MHMHDKYLLEFLLRSDASTKFAPENYWGFFPSVSAGWVISQEDWFKNNVKGIDYLKLRASFGLTGRDNTASMAVGTKLCEWIKIKVLVFGTRYRCRMQVAILRLTKIYAAVNRNAHWDKSYKANLGLGFQCSRIIVLSFAIDAYYDWNREMLLPVINASVPGYGGSTILPK